MNTFFSLLISMFLIYYFLHVTRIGKLLLMFCKVFIKFISIGCLGVKFIYVKADNLNKKLKDKLDNDSNKPSTTNIIDLKKYTKRKAK